MKTIFLLLLCCSTSLWAQRHRVIKIRRVDSSTVVKEPVYIRFYFNVLESPSISVHRSYPNTLWFIPPDSIREDRILLRSGDVSIQRKMQFYYQHGRSEAGSILPFKHFPASYKGREYDFLKCYYDPLCKKQEKAFKGYPPMNLMLRQEHVLEALSDTSSAAIHIYHLRNVDTAYMGTFFLPLRDVCLPSLKMRSWKPIQPIAVFQALRELELEDLPFDHKAACADARIRHYRLRIYRKKRKKPYFQIESGSERIKYKALSVFNTKLQAGHRLVFDEIYSELGDYPPLEFTVK